MPDTLDVFLSEEEIVTDMLLYRLTETEKVTLRNVAPDDLGELCSELSPALIEHYRLDDENNPYTNQDVLSHIFPTKVSYRIVEKTWSRLSGKNVPVKASEVASDSSYDGMDPGC